MTKLYQWILYFYFFFAHYLSYVGVEIYELSCKLSCVFVVYFFSWFVIVYVLLGCVGRQLNLCKINHSSKSKLVYQSRSPSITFEKFGSSSVHCPVHGLEWGVVSSPAKLFVKPRCNENVHMKEVPIWLNEVRHVPVELRSANERGGENSVCSLICFPYNQSISLHHPFGAFKSWGNEVSIFLFHLSNYNIKLQWKKIQN